MKKFLPEVQAEIGHSLAQSIGDVSDKAYVKKELKNILKENPVIADLITEWLKESKDKVTTALCGILVYKMLRSQAEADQMNEDFKLD